jgi:hypothetical protein
LKSILPNRRFIAPGRRSVPNVQEGAIATPAAVAADICINLLRVSVADLFFMMLILDTVSVASYYN